MHQPKVDIEKKKKKLYSDSLYFLHSKAIFSELIL